MHLAALFAAVELSTEASVIVIAIVGTLWTWSVAASAGRREDLAKALAGRVAECNELRRQNEGLYSQLLAAQREVLTLKAKLNGD